MGNTDRNDILEFIEAEIKQFHERRLRSLESLQLDKILLRKNPYMLKAKNLNTAADRVKSILDAYLSSQEESLFGDFLEALAVFVCEKFYGGRKSTAEGIDLEFQKDNVIYLVSIKSGPSWGNSQQIERMKDCFRKAKKILGGNTRSKKIVAINGCCYGKDDNFDKGDYLKLCGQRFWEFITGDEDFYAEIIEPIGRKAKEKNEAFAEQYNKVINRFTLEFSKRFCSPDGAILWRDLIKYNSGKSLNSKA